MKLVIYKQLFANRDSAIFEISSQFKLSLSLNMIIVNFFVRTIDLSQFII